MTKTRKFRVLSLVLSLMLLLGGTCMCYAKQSGNEGSREWEEIYLRHIDVYVSGTITVDTQLNGVSQEKKSGTITVSNLTATVVDGETTNTYTRFSTQSQIGTGEQEFHADTQRYSKSAVITISGTMKCDELGINTQFSKEFSGDAIETAYQECPGKIGCDFRITETDIVNTVTHDVVFKTEAGGNINSGKTDISYTNIIDGTTFPEVPQTTADKHYEFAGWYNEENQLVKAFPTTVDKDYVFVAKWKQVSTDPTPVKPVAAAYFVKHYQEQKDGTYKEVEEDTQKLTGEIGKEVTATANSYENYTYNAEKSTASGIVIQPKEVDGNVEVLTLKLYYDLKTEPTPPTPPTPTEPEDPKPTPPTPTEPENPTPTPTTPSEPETPAPTETTPVVSEEPKETEEPTPVGTTEATYFVKHYKEQADGTYKEVKKDRQKLTADVGEEVTATINSYKNHTYNAEKSTASGIVINPEEADGKKLTLKLYYDLDKPTETVEDETPSQQITDEPVETEKEPTEDKEEEKVKEVPRTGENNTSLALMCTAGILSAAGICGVLAKKKKKN